ncbi:MAG: hypothetical protein ABG776_08480 [Cyanobacteria bacterium J06555_13]
MLIAVKVLAIALAALLANTLLNQLPTLRDFKGKTGILIRLILVLTWLAATDTVLKSEASEVVKVVCRYGSVAAVVALLYDASALVKGVRQAKLANSTEPTAGALADSQSLQARLVKEVRFRVRERLDYAVGQRSLMEVPMVPVPDEVGRVARPEAVRSCSRDFLHWRVGRC